MQFRRPVSCFLCLVLLDGSVSAGNAPPLPAEPAKVSRPVPDPRDSEREFRLAAARQTARDLASSPVTRSGNDPFAEIEAAPGLWNVRARLARAVTDASRRDIIALRQHLAGVEPGRLGLDGLDSWLFLAASLPKTGSPSAGLLQELNNLAARSPSIPVAMDALWTATPLARTPQDRSALSASLERIPKASPDRPRLSTRRALAEGRLLSTEKERLLPFSQLLEAVPDAPERFPDLFDDRDLKTFAQAARTAPLPVRVARARTLIPRKTDEGIALLNPYGDGTPSERLSVAETLALGGRLVDARKELQRLAAEPAADPEITRRIPALLLSLEMRISMLHVTVHPTSPKPHHASRRGKKKSKVKAIPVETPRPQIPPSVSDPILALLQQTDSLLKGDVAPQDRKRLLADAVKLAAAAGMGSEARRILSDLVTVEPFTTAGAEDLFRDAFRAYRKARGSEFLEVAKDLETQASIYRESSTRRRATYWAARARAKGGDQAGARPLFSSLLSTAAPDLYGRWAAAALGANTPALSASTASEPAPVLTSTEPGPVERELLAAGLPDLAEEAAELAGRSQTLLSALAAWERREFRKAVILLKNRFPELGTQNEQSVPLSIRRLYYPSVHTAVIESEASAKSLPLPLVLGLIRQESIFEANARSWAGALGLMQVMPATGKQLYRQEHRGGKPDLLDPAVNIQLGTRYIADMLRMFQGDVVAALAAYNAGPGRVSRWKREMAHLEIDEFVESMPLTEPRDYVKRVLYFKSAYSAVYGLPSPMQVDQSGGKRLQLRLASTF